MGDRYPVRIDHDPDTSSGRQSMARAPSDSLDRQVLDSTCDAIVATDADFRIRLVNKAAEAVYGITETASIGQPVGEVITTDHGSADGERAAWNALLDRKCWSGRVRQRGSGTWHEVVLTTNLITESLTSANLASDGSGDRIIGAVFVAHDATELSRTEQAANERFAFAAAVLESLPGRTCVVDRSGQVVATNNRYRYEGPAGAGEATGPSIGQDYVAWVAETIDDEASFAIRELLEGERPDFRTEFAMVRRRRRNWTELDAVPLGTDSGGAVISHTDITVRKQAESTLTRRATHDALTGLPNRVLLADRLSHALARSSRTEGRVGVLFCDLDGFRDVNNKYGHLAGDRLLVTVAQRLRAVCRSSDTVARVSGDEFVIVLEDVTGKPEVEEVARRVIEALTEPIEMENGAARSGVSIGLTLSTESMPDGMRAVEMLIRDADVAMYAAKEAGRARYAWFTPEMRDRARERPTFARAIGRLLRG